MEYVKAIFGTFGFSQRNVCKFWEHRPLNEIIVDSVFIAIYTTGFQKVAKMELLQNSTYTVWRSHIKWSLYSRKIECNKVIYSA